MRNVIFTMLVATSATLAYAGFFDGIKKIGGGVVEAAGSSFDSVVSVTTNGLRSISSGTDGSAERAQQSSAAQANVTSDSSKQDFGSGCVRKKPTQYELEQARRKRNDEERERRYQAEQERQRVGREKYQAEQAAHKKAEREEADRRRAEAEKQRVERENARKEQEEREQAERANAEADRKAAEQAERDRIAAEKAAIEKTKRDAVEKVHSTLANFHAKAAGNPEGYEFKPISVYRDVKLGMTIEEVCSALGIKDVQGFLREADKYDKWLGGKAQKVVLEKHTLFLQFAHISGDTINSALVSVQMEFNDKDKAPTPAEVYEKYATIPNVKSRKEKQKHGDKFKDDTPQFWKLIYWKVSHGIEFQKKTSSDSLDYVEGLLPKLEADEKAIRANIVEDVFREVDVFDVDGMQICVKPKVETGKISVITFEDVVVADYLVKLKENQRVRKEKTAAKAKAEAEKKAKADTLNF